MAGTNQHYIPQFLQRGFASHKHGKQSYVWEFSKGTAPENAKTQEIGAEDNFYTEPGDTVVDDTITKAENARANTVIALRNGLPGPVSNAGLPELLTHFEVRTRHLRQSFLEGATTVVTKLIDRLCDPDLLAPSIAAYLEKNPDVMKKAVAARSDLSAQPLFANAVISMAMASRDKLVPAFVRAQAQQIAALFSAIKSQLPEALKKGAKEGHLRALKASIEPQDRARAFGHLIFRVQDTGAIPIILGDSVCLFAVDASMRFRPFTEKGNDIRAALLPLSPNRILIGEAFPTQWDFAQVRDRIAACSLEVFLSDRNSPEIVGLCKLIGSEAAMMSESELDQIVEDVIAKALGG